MIIFLNFAPINFMGGAEKWMLDTASHAEKYEKCILVHIDKKIADTYGKAVLHRTFKNNLAKHGYKNIPKIIPLSYKHFVPLTQEWKNIKTTFKNARIIYARFELPEVIICLYFGGIRVLKKTIAGIHLSISYLAPIGIMNRIHNFLYTSIWYRRLLQNTYRVHVLNKRDAKYLTETFNLDNVVYFPNSTMITGSRLGSKIADKKLHIIFVGELSLRKGVDTIIETIEIAPAYYNFVIVGKGPMEKDIEETAQRFNNCKYYGYLTCKMLDQLYQASDVLFFPSRAEAFGLVMIEALARGLIIVNSKEIELMLPKNMERTVNDRNPISYIAVFDEIYKEKTLHKIDKNSISIYCKKHFSSETNYPKFFKNILEINRVDSYL